MNRLLLPLAAIIVVALLLAAPRPGPQSVQVSVPPGQQVVPATTEGRTGAPLDSASVPTAVTVELPPVGAPNPSTSKHSLEQPSAAIGDPASARNPAYTAPPEPEYGTIAKWYPWTKGYGDLATVALPDGHYIPFGRPVPYTVVCVFPNGQARCATLPVVDCLCKRANPNQIVDLSLAAVRLLRLDPLTGVWPATVERLP